MKNILILYIKINSTITITTITTTTYTKNFMKPVVNLYKLGRVSYIRALNVQQVLSDKLKKNVIASHDHGDVNHYDSFSTTSQAIVDGNNSINFRTTSSHCKFSSQTFGIGNSLILVEHEPVFTIGIRSKQYDDNYVSQLKKQLDELKLKADFVKTNRGGLITFHGPGQLVAYPIIYLGDFKRTIQNRSVKVYVSLLEATIIDTLSRVGIRGAHTVREYPGVWLANGERKIAFVGISCKRFVTMHGISINCNCDLSWFDHIVSCGIEDKSITSIQRELDLIQDNIISSTHKQELLSVSSQKNAINPLLDTQVVEKYSKLDDGLRNNRQVESNVEHISEAFCKSFSQHFDCNLIEANNNFGHSTTIEDKHTI